MNITTSSTTVIHIELPESEARSALAEPAPLLAAIRAALQPIGAARAVASGRKKRDPVITPKVHASGRGRHYAPRERKPCTKCGRMMTAQGLSKHYPICQGKGSA